MVREPELIKPGRSLKNLGVAVEIVVPSTYPEKNRFKKKKRGGLHKMKENKNLTISYNISRRQK